MWIVYRRKVSICPYGFFYARSILKGQGRAIHCYLDSVPDKGCVPLNFKGREEVINGKRSCKVV